MNKLILMGRLTRDPEVTYAQGQDGSYAIARFSIAVDRKFKRQGEPDADFFNCVAFRKQAEFVERYLRKGTKMLVIGTLQNNNYTNRDGQKVYGVQVIVEELEFAESKSAGNNDYQQYQPQPSTASSAGDGFMNIPDGFDEELPFN